MTKIRVGVTKPISSVPLFSPFSNIAKTYISYWISRLYLTGVAVAQLRWHQANMNVIQRILTGTFARSKILLMEKLTKGALVTPTPDLPCWRGKKWFGVSGPKADAVSKQMQKVGCWSHSLWSRFYSCPLFTPLLHMSEICVEMNLPLPLCALVDVPLFN